MASPQLENGHTRIANEVIESVCQARLPGNALSVLLYILRQTYGWGGRKKTDPFLPTAVGGRINMSKSSVSLAINVLIERGIISRDSEGRLSFHKDHEKWVDAVQPTERKRKKPVQPTEPSVQPAEQSVQPTEPSVQPAEPYKEKERKKERKKKETAIPSPGCPELVKPKTDVQRIVEAYKHAKAIPMDDKVWDSNNFKRYCRAGKSLLDCFGGDLDLAAKYLFLRAEQLSAKDLDWTLETIEKHAWVGMGIPKEEGDGKQHRTLESNCIPGPVGPRRVARAGEVVSETMRGIEHAAVRAEGTTRLEGLGVDSWENHEPFE